MGNDRTKNDRRFNEIVEDLGEFKEDYKNVVNHVQEKIQMVERKANSSMEMPK